MKKYTGVLKRVREIENKKGRNYQTTDSKLYKGLKVTYILAFIYTMAINALFILGMIITLDSAAKGMSNVVNGLIIVSIGTALIIAGLVVMKFKKHLISGLLSFIPEVALIFIFANMMKEDIEGLWGYKYSFYYRHGVPLLLMALLITGMTVIAMREEHKTNITYKKVVENLYSEFTAENGENVSEEEWTEYLKNYDPDKNRKNKTKDIKEKIFKD